MRKPLISVIIPTHNRANYIGETIESRGPDVRLCSPTCSWTTPTTAMAARAAVGLDRDGVDAEVIDVRSLKSLDESTILTSVHKTGRLVIADGGWKSAGATTEIAARVAEHGYNSLRASSLHRRSS